MRIIEKKYDKSLQGIASKIAALFSPVPVVREDLARISDDIANEAARGLAPKD